MYMYASLIPRTRGGGRPETQTKQSYTPCYTPSPPTTNNSNSNTNSNNTNNDNNNHINNYGKGIPIIM